MHIRAEEQQDRDVVHAVNATAFDSPAEADLVDALRQQEKSLLSLVAEMDGVLIGHILFSPVSLAGHPDLSIMGLGPMAVVPAHQRQGVGTALVRAGLERCRRSGVAAVIVLGHPEYYPRFGFLPASRFGISSEFDVPDEVFMVLELQPRALQGKSGQASYHPLFSDV